MLQTLFDALANTCISAVVLCVSSPLNYMFFYIHISFMDFTVIKIKQKTCGMFNTLRTGLLNCLNARSRGLIQSEVRFL